jgi:hypothetical protein
MYASQRPTLSSLFISKKYPSGQILEAFGDIKDGRKADI